MALREENLDLYQQIEEFVKDPKLEIIEEILTPENISLIERYPEEQFKLFFAAAQAGKTTKDDSLSSFLIRSGLKPENVINSSGVNIIDYLQMNGMEDEALILKNLDQDFNRSDRLGAGIAAGDKKREVVIDADGEFSEPDESEPEEPQGAYNFYKGFFGLNSEKYLPFLENIPKMVALAKSHSAKSKAVLIIDPESEMVLKTSRRKDGQSYYDFIKKSGCEIIKDRDLIQSLDGSPGFNLELVENLYNNILHHSSPGTGVDNVFPVSYRADFFKLLALHGPTGQEKDEINMWFDLDIMLDERKARLPKASDDLLKKRTIAALPVIETQHVNTHKLSTESAKLLLENPNLNKLWKRFKSYAHKYSVGYFADTVQEIEEKAGMSDEVMMAKPGEIPVEISMNNLGQLLFKILRKFQVEKDENKKLQMAKDIKRRVVYGDEKKREQPITHDLVHALAIGHLAWKKKLLGDGIFVDPSQIGVIGRFNVGSWRDKVADIIFMPNRSGEEDIWYEILKAQELILEKGLPKSAALSEFIAEDLPERSRETEATDKNEEFYRAARDGDVEKMEDLYKSGEIDINHKHRKTLGTALEIASYHGHSAATSFLMDNGADFGALNGEGDFNPIETALLSSDETSTIMLHKAILNGFNPSQSSLSRLLRKAVIYGRTEFVKTAAAKIKGLDIGNSRFDYNEGTLICSAILKGDEEMLRTLLDLDPNPQITINRFTSDQNRPIIQALYLGHTKMVDLLVDHGANLIQRDDERRSISDMAKNFAPEELAKKIRSKAEEQQKHQNDMIATMKRLNLDLPTSGATRAEPTIFQFLKPISLILREMRKAVKPITTILEASEAEGTAAVPSVKKASPPTPPRTRVTKGTTQPSYYLHPKPPETDFTDDTKSLPITSPSEPIPEPGPRPKPDAKKYEEPRSAGPSPTTTYARAVTPITPSQLIATNFNIILLIVATYYQNQNERQATSINEILDPFGIGIQGGEGAFADMMQDRFNININRVNEADLKFLEEEDRRRQAKKYAQAAQKQQIIDFAKGRDKATNNHHTTGRGRGGR